MAVEGLRQPGLPARLSGDMPPARHAPAQIGVRTQWVAMRDGTRLATDVYLPPILPAPVIVTRTPYGRMADKRVNLAMAFARRGYAVVLQDCRGTGESEPASWDYYVFESEDSPDLVDWIAGQDWCDGFVASFGGSYDGQTQWCMATHKKMGAIAPEVSGLGVAQNTVALHLFINSYARSVGKGATKQAVSHGELERRMFAETLATGLFNAPLDPALPDTVIARFPELAQFAPSAARIRLWQLYADMPSIDRARFIRELFDVEGVSIAEIEALPAIFGQSIAHDAHTIPYANRAAMARAIMAPALMVTGWYDWGLPDALATWALLRSEAQPEVAEGSRLVIGPGSHGSIGYREGMSDHPELRRPYRSEMIPGLLLEWYEAVRAGATGGLARVSYYLMGANEWRTAADWPAPGYAPTPLYLGADGTLTAEAPREGGAVSYAYDPRDPTPTMGGSILSSVISPGSVDVQAAQARDDVVCFTSPPLAADLDVVGPVTMRLFASSSATDTDFTVRLTDVFPDGRAIQLQSGMLRARHRGDIPSLIEPGEIYPLEIDMWATANRFKVGHRIRIDIASADFPRFERNANLGGKLGEPIIARQSIYCDPDHPSHVLLPIPAGQALASLLDRQ
ncbi:CocE/NonD family hydrolase [Rhizorhabdus dicambivorans]|nr:CocE/NonD family hydrolase [Rhizorhabdus dicambivorans]